MRTVTVDEYILEQLNKRLAARGENVRIVSERPRPEAVKDNVVKLKPEGFQC